MPQRTLSSALSIAALIVGLLALARTTIDSAQASTLTGTISPQAALGSGFTYQGYLTRSGAPINGQDQCDIRFSLWDAASVGAQIGNLQVVNAVDFTNGSFTATLNEAGQFGTNAFSGEVRWLQVDLACPSGSSNYTSMGRQAITAVPYALHSMSTSALQGRAVSTIAPSVGQTLKWDGTAWSPATTYARTILVSPAGTAAESGTVLLNALNAITDASAEKPYLLKIEPGVYDLVTTSLQMKPYVDIEGSGETVTRLLGRYTDSFSGAGTVRGANNAELRFLSIEVTQGPGSNAVPFVADGVSPRITSVTAIATGSTQAFGMITENGAAPILTNVTLRAATTVYSTGMYNGGDSSPILRSVTIVVTGTGANAGIYNVRRSSPVLTDVTIDVAPGQGYSFGLYGEQSSHPQAHNSRIRATTALRVSSGTIRVAASQIDGAVNATSGSTVTCVGAYNANFAALNASCQ